MKVIYTVQRLSFVSSLLFGGLLFIAVETHAQVDKIHTGSGSAVIDRMIEKNKEISRGLDKRARALDHFLSREHSTNEKNTTALILENTMDWRDGKSPTFNTQVDIRLHLPNLEKKWKLRFTSYDEDSEGRGINENRLKTSAPKENYGASLTFEDRFGDLDVSFRPRLEVKGSSATSYILKLKTSVPKKHFTILPGLEFFARSDTGTGQFAALNFEFPINEIFSAGIINEQQYLHLEHRLEVTHGLAFSHVYNDRMYQNYSLNFEYNNKPGYHLNRYTFASAFNHHLYKNVLHYRITPYVEWHEDHSFGGRFGMEVNVALIF